MIPVLIYYIRKRIHRYRSALCPTSPILYFDFDRRICLNPRNLFDPGQIIRFRESQCKDRRSSPRSRSDLVRLNKLGLVQTLGEENFHRSKVEEAARTNVRGLYVRAARLGEGTRNISGIVARPAHATEQISYSFLHYASERGERTMPFFIQQPWGLREQKKRDQNDARLS